MKTKISAALEYFSHESKIIEDLDFPDTGIDYAFMLKAEEWKILSEKWDQHSDAWKNAITYFAGFAYLNESACIITKALQHQNKEIILQALFSIYESLSAEIDNEGKTDPEFTSSEKEKILFELEARKNEFDLYPELEELTKMMNTV